MRKRLLLSATPVLLATAFATGASVTPERRAELNRAMHCDLGMNRFGYTARLNAGLMSGFEEAAARFGGTRAERMRRAAPVRRTARAAEESAPTATPLPDNHSFGFLDAPNGEAWFYTVNFDYEVIEHEYYTEKLIKGFTVTVYDADMREVGTISDAVTLAEGETRIAQIQVDATLTRKFYNYDDKYEVMVTVDANCADYSMNTYTLVYQLGAAPDAEGHTPVIARMDGYVCDAINAAADAWSEDYYISFLTYTDYDDEAESFGEFAASRHMVATTYRKAGYNDGVQQLSRFEVSMASLPGDMMNFPFLISTVRDGVPTFIVQQYEKWFYNNAVGPGMPDETDPDAGMPTKDNHLLVDVYEYRGGQELTPVQHTEIDASQERTNPDVMFNYYGIGTLGYDCDLLEDGSLNVSLYQYLISDDDNYLYSYRRYGADGTPGEWLAREVTGTVYMSDLAGHEPQAMFVNSQTIDTGDGSLGITTGTFEMVDLFSGETAAVIPIRHNDYPLKANVDRVARGDSYMYAFETSQVGSDSQGNTIEEIVWCDAEGTIERVDRLNLGRDIAMAQVYISRDALNPYVFNTDEAYEYMWLVKRLVDRYSSQTETQLVIPSSEGDNLMTLGPDDRGNLATVTLVTGQGGHNRLMVTRRNADYVYSPEMFDLPLSRFAGGTGTADDPWLIETYGDLIQVGSQPAGHYLMTADIDASAYSWSTVKGSFTGSLSGDGHTVTGLRMEGNGSMFECLEHGSAVRDLRLTGVHAGSLSSTSGVIAANARGAEVSGIRIHGLEIAADNDVTWGAVVGIASLGTTVSDCAVTGAAISLPASSDVGGIVGETRTGSQIQGCSFAGSIEADSNLGGIVGSQCADGSVTDCHADADLTARRVVGGIAGYTAGGKLTRNYVEGSVEAVGPELSYTDHGPCAGGVTGYLKPEYNTLGAEPDPNAGQPVVQYNYVALESLKGYTPQSAQVADHQFETIHRIVGYSSINEIPAIKDYDENDNPIYDEPLDPERRLTDNYAAASLAPADSGIEDAPGSTEGQSVQPGELSQQWFATALGLKFGDTEPWNGKSDSDPWLNNESGHYCLAPELTAVLGKWFDVSVVYVSPRAVTEEGVMDGFSYECTPEIAEMSGEYSWRDNVLTVEFKALAEGQASLKVCGAECALTVIDDGSGVDMTSRDIPAIEIAGTEVLAPGRDITVFTAAGARVRSGAGTVSLKGLEPGVYVVSDGQSGRVAVIR